MSFCINLSSSFYRRKESFISIRTVRKMNELQFEKFSRKQKTLVWQYSLTKVFANVQ